MNRDKVLVLLHKDHTLGKLHFMWLIRGGLLLDGWGGRAGASGRILVSAGCLASTAVACRS